MAEQNRRSWTSQDNQALIDCWERVGSVVLIAMMLDRSPSSVQTQASRLGLPRRREGRTKHRRPWTDEDSAALDAAIAEFSDSDGSFPIKAVADKLGRSIDAVVARLAAEYDDPQRLFERIIMPPKPPADAEAGLPRRAAPAPRSVGDPRKQPKKRPCLNCQETFWSSGAHNRVCPKCKRREPDFDA
mgnify:CR=1 FL=1